MGMNNEFNFRWQNPVKMRSCAYLNNVVEMERSQMIDSAWFAAPSYL